MNAMALDITAMAEIKLTAKTSGSTDALYLIQASDLQEGFNAGYCSLVPALETKSVAFYAYFNSTEYVSFGTKDLGTMAFGLKTNADTDYTLSVTTASGTQTLWIYDKVADQYFELKAGATYDFTATANETNVTRFALSAAPATDPTICHYYNKLEVRNSNGMTVQVLNLDGSATSVADANITTDSKVDIDLSGLAAGQYLVKWNGKELIIQQ